MVETHPVRRWVAPLAAALVLTGCASHHYAAPKLPPPVATTSVGPGDTFTVLVMGEHDFPGEYHVQADGTVTFPFLDRVKVDGLEPQQVEELLKKELEDKKILTRPQVFVAVKQYNSKHITLIGALAKPGILPWVDGLKLVDAIMLSGGLSPLADADHVLLTRQVVGGGAVTASVNIDAITEGKLSDIPLQAGDTIKIGARMF
jgi:polysaccharide export outer membrane protein